MTQDSRQAMEGRKLKEDLEKSIDKTFGKRQKHWRDEARCHLGGGHRKLIKLDTLSENFKNLYANKVSCDVTLLVEDKVFKAHKAVLIAQSPVLAATFRHEMSGNETVVNIPDCSAEFFNDFLEYLYCGKLEMLLWRSAFHLYKISGKYDVQKLKQFCMEFLTENLTPENFCAIVMLAAKYDDATLFSASQKFFNRNLIEVFNTEVWVNFLKTNSTLANKLLKEMAKARNAIQIHQGIIRSNH